MHAQCMVLRSTAAHRSSSDPTVLGKRLLPQRGAPTGLGGGGGMGQVGSGSGLGKRAPPSNPTHKGLGGACWGPRGLGGELGGAGGQVRGGGSGGGEGGGKGPEGG